MENRIFKENDLVRLNHRIMRVFKVDDDNVYCSWFDADGINREIIIRSEHLVWCDETKMSIIVRLYKGENVDLEYVDSVEHFIDNKMVFQEKIGTSDYMYKIGDPLILKTNKLNYPNRIKDIRIRLGIPFELEIIVERIQGVYHP